MILHVHVTCCSLYYFSSDIEADQPTPRCTAPSRSNHFLTKGSPRTNVALAKFGQIYPCYKHYILVKKRLIFQGKLMETCPCFGISGQSVSMANYSTFDHFGADLVLWPLEICAFVPCVQWHHAMYPSLGHGFQKRADIQIVLVWKLWCYNQLKRYDLFLKHIDLISKYHVLWIHKNDFFKIGFSLSVVL